MTDEHAHDNLLQVTLYILGTINRWIINVQRLEMFMCSDFYYTVEKHGR